MTEKIFSAIKSDLSPSPSKVLAKLGALHLVTGSLTLTVCPQFGVGPLGGGAGLMSTFMAFGPSVCALFCGGFFMGTTALLSAWVLSAAERRVSVHNCFWQYSSLAIFSMMALMALGKVVNGVVPESDWGYVGLWSLAAAVSGAALASLASRIRGYSIKS